MGLCVNMVELLKLSSIFRHRNRLRGQGTEVAAGLQAARKLELGVVVAALAGSQNLLLLKLMK